MSEQPVMSQKGWASSRVAELRGTDAGHAPALGIHHPKPYKGGVCERDDTVYSLFPGPAVICPQRLHTEDFDKLAPFPVSVPSPVVTTRQIYYWHLSLKNDLICLHVYAAGILCL